MTTSLLPTVADLTAYLRIQTTAENALLAQLLTRAQGEIEAAVGKALTHETAVWHDDAVTLRRAESVTNLLLGYTPIDESTVVVKDGNGATVDASTYQIRQDRGMICSFADLSFISAPARVFDAGPYTIICVAGFDTSPTYATREGPMIAATVLDYAAYLYQQRTPGARVERSAGTSVEYEIDPECGLPHRIARAVKKLRGPVFAR